MDTTNRTDGKRYLYGRGDEKYVKLEPRKPKPSALHAFKFRPVPDRDTTDIKAFNKTDVPVLFKCSPDTLINLCLQVLDALPLPQVYDWSIEDVCNWLSETGFKQYQNTFRHNLITGRNLLLLDAAALSAMNIKDFQHIKQITRAIRELYSYEMPKFGRCLSLQPEYHNNLYKLLRLKTGAKYNLRRSDVWRKEQLIRPQKPNLTHWEALERWLDCDKHSQTKELIGGICRFNLYACKTAHPPGPAAAKPQSYLCACIPPCDCFLSEPDYRHPWKLKCLPHPKTDKEFLEPCKKCVLPCNCRWPSKSYKIHGVLSCLKKGLPHKYDYSFGLVHERKSEHIYFSVFPII